MRITLHPLLCKHTPKGRRQDLGPGLTEGAVMQQAARLAPTDMSVWSWLGGISGLRSYSKTSVHWGWEEESVLGRVGVGRALKCGGSELCLSLVPALPGTA